MTMRAGGWELPHPACAALFWGVGWCAGGARWLRWFAWMALATLPLASCRRQAKPRKKDGFESEDSWGELPESSLMSKDESSTNYGWQWLKSPQMRERYVSTLPHVRRRTAGRCLWCCCCWLAAWRWLLPLGCCGVLPPSRPAPSNDPPRSALLPAPTPPPPRSTPLPLPTRCHGRRSSPGASPAPRGRCCSRPGGCATAPLASTRGATWSSRSSSGR
jgi:hypothetical protein